MKLNKKERAVALSKFETFQDRVIEMEGRSPVKGYILSEFGRMLGNLKSSEEIQAAQFEARFKHWKALCGEMMEGRVASARDMGGAAGVWEIKYK